MNILTFVNIIPNLEQLSEKDFQVESPSKLDTFFLPKSFDLYNESALEIALRSCDASESASLNVVSVGNSDIEYMLKELYAHGYDSITRINSSGGADVAEALANYVQTLGEMPDIYLFGKKGMMQSSGAVPLEFASRMDLPVIFNVLRIGPTSKNGIIVETIQDNSTITRRIQPPFVGIVGDAPNTMLRIPTLKQKLSAKKLNVNISEFETTASTTTEVQKCALVDNSRKCEEIVFNSGDTAKTYIESFVEKNRSLKAKSIGKSKTPQIKSLIFARETDNNNEIAVRYALQNEIEAFLGVDRIEQDGKSLRVIRKEYNGSLLCSHVVDSKDIICTIADNSLPDFNLNIEYPLATASLISEQTAESTDDLENADAVFVVGAGVSLDTLPEIKKLAKKNNAVLCGSRQAAMSNLVPLSHMLGVSGKSITAGAAVCFGISGAAAFMAGIEGCDKILSVNSNKNAPISEKSDFFIHTSVEDIFS